MWTGLGVTVCSGIPRPLAGNHVGVCDECDQVFPPGTRVHGCRQCGYDLCADHTSFFLFFFSPGAGSGLSRHGVGVLRGQIWRWVLPAVEDAGAQKCPFQAKLAWVIPSRTQHHSSCRAAPVAVPLGVAKKKPGADCLAKALEAPPAQPGVGPPVPWMYTDRLRSVAVGQRRPTPDGAKPSLIWGEVSQGNVGQNQSTPKMTVFPSRHTLLSLAL